MVNTHSDQAEGLRRMLSFSHARTIAIVAGTRGAGATSCVVNLATALARQGSRVLVVDENFDANVGQMLGVRTRYDFKHAISGACTLEEALTAAPGGFMLLTAAAAARALPRLDTESREQALECFAQLDDMADVVLLDVRNDGLEPSPFAAAAQEVIVVVSQGSPSITGGYAAMKRMSHSHGRQSFRLVVNRAHDGATTRTVESNMRHVARKHLNVALDFLGAIPQDAAVSASVRRFSAVVEAAPAAAASRQFCELASTMQRWPALHDEVSRLDNFMQRAIYGSRIPAAAGV
jgi:flagellar biosynthesis protein FlhG